LRAMGDNAYSLAIVDPPYGLGIDGQKSDFRHSSGKYHKSKWGRKGHDQKGWDVRPQEEYFEQLFRVSKNQVVWGGNYFVEHISPSKGWIFWYKGQQGLTMSDGEMAWSSFNVPTRMFTLNRMALTQEGTIHPTQKPVKLYKWLLKNYAKPGDTILDTHLGSMSSVIACIEMGFDVTGYELDADYFKAGVDRVRRHLRQQDMFRADVDLQVDWGGGAV